MNEIITVTPNDINLIEEKDSPQLFTKEGVKFGIEVAKAYVASCDVSLDTATARKEFASKAAVFNAAKATVRRKAKDYTAEEEARIKGIKSLAKELEAGLESVRVAFRQPLTDWEAAEEKRKEEQQVIIDRVRALGNVPHGATLAEIIDRINTLESHKPISFDKDFAESGNAALEFTEKTLNIAKEAAEQAEKQAAELAALRAKQAEQEAAERERMQKEAAEKAEREAKEEEQRRENKRLKDEADAAIARAAAAERAAKESEERAEREKLAAIEAERQRAAQEEQRRKDEAERAEREKAETLAAEKARAEAAEKAAKEEKRRQDAITAARAKSITEMRQAFEAIMPNMHAEKATQAIIDGNIPHVTFQPNIEA